MKTLKITNSLPYLIVFLATFAKLPALHTSQASAQGSASFSGMSSRQAPAISTVSAIPAANSGSLAASSIGSSSSVPLTTKKPNKTTVTDEQFMQLVERGDMFSKKGDFVQAIRLYRLAFDNTSDRPRLQAHETILFLGIDMVNNPQNGINLLVMNGHTFMVKNQLAESFSSFVRAYYLSKSLGLPKIQMVCAEGIGSSLYQKGNHNEALSYFEQAHELFEKLDNTTRQQLKLWDDGVACFLGKLYLDYEEKTNHPDYKKAFHFLMQAYYTSYDNIKRMAASHLGYIYLDGLGQTVDLVRARSLFKEAVMGEISLGSTTSETFRRASAGLFLAKYLQLEKFDDFYQSLRDNHSEDRMKEAYVLLDEARQTQSPPDLNILLEAQIKIHQEKLDKFVTQLAQDNIRKEQQDAVSKKTSVPASVVSSGTVNRQCAIENQAIEKATIENAEANLQTMIKEADAELEAYRNKPSNDRYQRAQTLYYKLFQLSKKEPSIRKHIRQQLHILEEGCACRSGISNILESGKKKEEKRDTQQAVPWTLLYHHDIAHLEEQKKKGQTRLLELAINPTHVLQSEPVEALSQSYSARCGSGDRIIYVVLPQHRVGIINIGPHEDYERVSLLRHRENWFLHPTPEAITLAIEQARKRNDEEQAKALTKFLQQSRAQCSSTDSKEAKEQKS